MTQKDSGLTITIDGHEPICYQDDDSLLACLERHNIPANSHCRDGFCGACRTKLVTGEVDYTTDPLAFIDDDEILTCCSKPLSDIHIIITE